jgi:hypothetical protein
MEAAEGKETQHLTEEEEEEAAFGGLDRSEQGMELEDLAE